MEIRECIDIVERANKKRVASISDYKLLTYHAGAVRQTLRFDVWEERTPQEIRAMARRAVEPYPGGFVVFGKTYTADEIVRRRREDESVAVDHWEIPAGADDAAMNDVIDRICRTVEQELESKEAKRDRKSDHPAHRYKPVRKALENICGEILGWGIDRKVYAHKKNKKLIVKVFRPEEPWDIEYDALQNAWEWRLWQDVQDKPQLAQWFAPCVKVSKDYRVLVQRRTEPATAADLHGMKAPRLVGLLDHHLENWGMLDGRPVLHDYGYSSSTGTGSISSDLIKRADMRKPIWLRVDEHGAVHMVNKRGRQIHTVDILKK